MIKWLIWQSKTIDMETSHEGLTRRLIPYLLLNDNQRIHQSWVEEVEEEGHLRREEEATVRSQQEILLSLIPLAFQKINLSKSEVQVLEDLNLWRNQVHEKESKVLNVVTQVFLSTFKMSTSDHQTPVQKLHQ